jgi:hypothetical protein
MEKQQLMSFDFAKQELQLGAAFGQRIPPFQAQDALMSLLLALLP